MPATAIPYQSYGALFLRFLRFGSLAWGGPVAQIAMLQKELVQEERWITPDRFNRALAVYQALPGPEAHELCVYFGMLARGRIGGVLAGLGFMLPGLVLMLLVSWLYVASQGALASAGHGILAGLQAAVLALIVRAVHRLGSHAIRDHWLLGTAIVSFAGSLAGVHFAINLALGGTLYHFSRRKQGVAAAIVVCAWLTAVVLVALAPRGAAAIGTPGSPPLMAASLPLLLYSGLKSGLLTFGGAYTAIPFLREDAVVRGTWMTNAQFLDGLALSGILPAPLIIFGTFVGFLGGGWLGSLALTTGIFLPAFGFTLVAHDALEQITQSERLRTFLDGMTAGVVGLIAATTVELAPAALSSITAGAVFAGALVLLYLINHKLSVILVMGCAAVAGSILS